MSGEDWHREERVAPGGVKGGLEKQGYFQLSS